MGEIDWRQIISLSQKELSPKKKQKLYDSVSWMDADDIEINFGDLKSLFLIAQDLMKFRADQVDTLTGQIDAMVQSDINNGKGDVVIMEQIEQQEEEIRANKDILEQLYRDIASLQQHRDNKTSIDKESTSSKDPLSELNDIKQLEMTISLKNEHLKKMLADLQATEEENVKLREKLIITKEKLSEATTHISHLTDQVTKLKSQSSHLKGKITELEARENTSSLDFDGLKQELRESQAVKNATIEELKLNIEYWKDSSTEKQANIDQMMGDISALKTQLKCLKDDTYFAQTVKQYKHQIKNLQSNLTEASQEIENSANVIEKLLLENKDMKEAVRSQTVISDTTATGPPAPAAACRQDVHMTRVKQKLQSKLADAREVIRSREEEIADLSGQIQILHRDDGIKSLMDRLNQQKRQLQIRDEHIKSLVSDINNMNEAIDNLQLENVAMREELNLEPEEKVSTVGILAKFSQMKKRAETAERKLSQLEESHLSLQLQARGCRGPQQPHRPLSGLDGGGDASSYLPRETKSVIESDSELRGLEMQNLIEENDGLRKGLHEILDFIKESVKAGKSTVDIGSESLDKVTATLDARHAAGWFAPHLATSAHLQRAIGARDALSTALSQVRREAYEAIDKLAIESQKTCDLENKLLALQKDQINLEVNSPDDIQEGIKNGVFGDWMTGDDFNAIDLDDKNSVQEVMLKSVNKGYVLQVRAGLAHFHHQFNCLYKQMTDLSITLLQEQQKWQLQDEQNKAQIENLQSQIAAFDNEHNSDNSVGAVHSSKVILERRCTYLEESFRYIRTINENLKNDYLACEKDKLVKIGNCESQIQSLLVNITSVSDRLRNSVPIDIFLKQNVKYNELNMKYRNLLDMKMQENDVIQIDIECNKVKSTSRLEAMEQDNKQLVELLPAQREHNINYVVVEETRDKQVKNMSRQLSAAACRVTEVEQEARKPAGEPAAVGDQLQHSDQPIQHDIKYTKELEKKLLDMQKQQKIFVDGALSSISREEHDQMARQAREQAGRNTTLNMEIAKVTNELEITALQLEELRQRQFCSDTEVNMLRHQVLDLQSRGDNEAVIARLSGEVLVSQLRTADMQRRLERASCELRHEQRRRREAEQQRHHQHTSAQMHASTYHSRLGFINEILQILREQYDGALPIVSVENYVNKLQEITSRSQKLETLQGELEDLKVTCQAKTDAYNKIIAAARCGLRENDCPHYVQIMLNKRVSARELEHCHNKVQSLEESRTALARRHARLERTLLTLAHSRQRQPAQLQLSDVTSASPPSSPSPSPPLVNGKMSLHRETRIVATLEGTPDASPHSLHTQTFVIDHDATLARADNVTLADATSQTEAILLKSSFTQTENMKAECSTEKHIEEIKSLSLTLAEKEEEMKNIFDKAEADKVSCQREVATLLQRENEKRQCIQKLVQQIDMLNDQVSQLHTVKVEFQEKMAAVMAADNRKNCVITESREMLKKEREEYKSSAAASQRRIEELQTDLEKLTIESNNLRAALLQPAKLKAVSDIVDKYTASAASCQHECMKLQETLDTCQSDLVSSQAEAERWKTLAVERLNKLEQLSANLEERHGQEVEWYRAESCHLSQQLAQSEQALCDVRQRAARERHDKLQCQKHIKLKIPLSQSELQLDEMSRNESPPGSLHEEPGSASRGEPPNIHQHDLPDRSGEGSPTPARSSSGSKSVHGKEQKLQERGKSTGAASQERLGCTARTDTKLRRNKAYTDRSDTNLQEQRRSADVAAAAHVAMWNKWKMCERSVERWRGKHAAQQQQLKVLQGRLASARAAVQRLQKEKRLLLDRDRDRDRDSHITSVVSSSRNTEAEQGELHCEAPHVSVGSLLARVEAQQRRIVALELASKGNETLVIEYERLLAQNTQLKKLNLKLDSQELESQLLAGSTAACKDDTEIRHLRSYVEMLKAENAELHARVEEARDVFSARTVDTPGAGARTEDLQRTVLTLRGLVAKLQAENKRLLAQRRHSGDLQSPARKDGVSPEELLRTENDHLKESIAQKELLLQRSGEVLRRAARREGELLHQISILESMVEVGHRSTCLD